MKSTSIKSKNAKPGDRRWWSALGLVTSDLSSVTEDANMEYEILDEGIGTALRNALNTAKKKLKSIGSTARKLIKRNFKGFLQFLGFDADIKFEIKF